MQNGSKKNKGVSDMQFLYIIDVEKEMDCLAGQYTPHDGIIMLNLAQINSIPEYISVETHEILHYLFDSFIDEITSEDQDHYIIKKVLWGHL